MSTYPKILAISGKRGAGKDCSAELIRHLTASEGIKWEELKFSEVLKRCTCEITGCSPQDVATQQGKTTLLPEYGMTVGEFLQRMGTGLRDCVNEDIWVKATLRRLDPARHYICTDVRFPNEVKALQDAGGLVLRITGDPLKQRGDGTRDDEHPSETALDKHSFPTIRNHTSKFSLRNKLVDLLRQLRAGKPLNPHSLAFK